jgi:hypothetical protein
VRKLLALVVVLVAVGAPVAADASPVQPPSREGCYLRFTVDGGIARFRCGDLMTVRGGECWIHREPEDVWMRCREARES